MRVLFINGDHPWEGQDGYYKLTRQILDMLSKEHEVHLVALAGEQKIVDGERDGLSSMNVLSVATKNKRVSQIKSIVSKESMVKMQFKQKELIQRVNEHIEAKRPEVIFLNHIRSAWLAPHMTSVARMIYIAHNAEAHAIGSISKNETGVMKTVTRLEASKLIKMETDILDSVNTCVTLTAEDRDRLLTLSGNPSYEVIPPPIKVPEVQNEILHPDLLLVGSYKWYPKRKNALWLAKEVLPLVIERFPTITMKFVGEAATLLREELGDSPNIEYHSDVPSIEPYLTEGNIFLVPERQEGGIKIKTLEAGSYGLPIIATKAGMEGTMLVRGESILEANTAKEFANQIMYLLYNPGEAKRIASTAHTTINQAFNAYRIQSQYKELLEEKRAMDVVR